MTVKEFYYATSLIGPISLTYSCIDIYGDDSLQQKTYPTATDLKCDLGHIGDYKIIHIQAIHGTLCIDIEKP